MTILNIALFAILFSFGTALFDLTPLIPFGLLFGLHLFLASLAAKEPHLDSLLEAWLLKQRKSKNLISEPSNKYIP